MLDGIAQRRAIVGIAQPRELLLARKAHERVPRRHAGVERRARARSIGRSNGWLRSSEKIAAPRARRLVEERLRAVPARARHVHLVAAAEPLDHDRQPAAHAELDRGAPRRPRRARRPRSSADTRCCRRPRGPSPRRARRARRSDAKRLGTGRPSPSTCVGECDDENPAAPAAIASRTHAAHRGDLVGRRLALRRVRPHHRAAQRRVADVAGEIHAEPSRARSEIFRERLELERDAVERGRRHALHHREHRAQVGAVRLARGRDREPAVAREHGRDAVMARRDRRTDRR